MSAVGCCQRVHLLRSTQTMESRPSGRTNYVCRSGSARSRPRHPPPSTGWLIDLLSPRHPGVSGGAAGAPREAAARRSHASAGHQLPRPRGARAGAASGLRGSRGRGGARRKRRAGGGLRRAAARNGAPAFAGDSGTYTGKVGQANSVEETKWGGFLGRDGGAVSRGGAQQPGLEKNNATASTFYAHAHAFPRIFVPPPPLPRHDFGFLLFSVGRTWRRDASDSSSPGLAAIHRPGNGVRKEPACPGWGHRPRMEGSKRTRLSPRPRPRRQQLEQPSQLDREPRPQPVSQPCRPRCPASRSGGRGARNLSMGVEKGQERTPSKR